MTTPTPSDKIVDDLVWCGRQLYHYEQPIMVPLSPEGFAAFDRARRMIHDYRRDLAAAQENLQSADEDRLRMRAQTARLDAALIEKDISIAARDAELASVKAERDALKRVHDDIMQAVDECGSYKP